MDEAKSQKKHHTLQSPLLRKLKSPIRQKIDFNIKEDTDRFMEIATDLYSLLDGYNKSWNKALYHGCCISFTLTGACSKANHPKHRTKTVRELFSLFTINSAEDLYKFIETEILKRDFSKRVFPAINLQHNPVRTLREDNSLLE